MWISDNMVLSSKNVREGRYWTLLSHTFMHANPGHLVFNMLGVWSFGQPMAMLWGVPAFITLWIGAGFTGGLTSLALQKEENVRRRYIGASGSVLGLSVAMACQFPRSKMIIIPIVILTRYESCGRTRADCLIAHSDPSLDCHNWVYGLECNSTVQRFSGNHG